MEKSHTPKIVKNQKDLDFIFSLKQDDIDLNLLKDLFAYKKDTLPRFDPSDIISLPKNKLYNKENISTTVGRYIFNLLLLTENIGNNIGYINIAMDGKGYSILEGKMSKLLLDDKITPDEFTEYIDKTQWLGFAISDFINPPLTTDLLKASDKVKQRKKELIDKHHDDLYIKKDIVVASKIEKELLDMSKDELKNLPDMDIYNSGSRGSFGNNYKMTAISRGVVPSVSNPKEINISMTSLEDGIRNDERYIFSDILTSASYNRAIGTQIGGYNKNIGLYFVSL